CVSDEEVTALRAHKLLVTGKSGTLRIDGAARDSNAFGETSADDGTRFQTMMRDEMPAAAAEGRWKDEPFWKFASAFGERNFDGIGEEVRIDAPPFVIAQAARVQGRMRVFLDNFTGIVA